MQITNNTNILITSAGRRVSLTKAFIQEAQALFGQQAKVYTTDLNPAYSAACRVASGSFKVGKFADDNYVDSIIDICIENKIGLLIPTIDTELLLLAKHAEKFKQVGCEVILSDTNLIEICRDKRLTNQFFVENNLSVPKEYSKNELNFPVFIKPFNGSSSNNLLLAKTEDDISKSVLNNKDMMFLEYLSKAEYDEYTVDIYYDRNSEIKCVVPRLRMETRQGEISKGITCNNFLVPFVLANLNNIRGFRGCITLQVFAHKVSQKIYGIEINPRFGGGYPLSHLAGANYVKWILQEYIKNETINANNDWQDNLLLLRHDNELVFEHHEN
jgi:carbamoyl-phosphate synthase large subunit